MHVVTRFPPSPTGYFHIGSARTALFNYLFAKHNGGKMVMRFEDTDRERSKKEFEKDILEGILWLGLEHDGAVLRQSERTDIYRERLATLIKSGHAYEAEESTTEAGKKVIRFKNPNVRVTFTDLIRGEVSFETAELEDFIIARTMNEPLYNFAVVVDDYDMGITHVIRGEDHISNTQRQILMLEALGCERPVYAHLPLILAPDKSKLSKRHGAVSVNEYRAEGYLPEALVNYLALLGWNPGGQQELFSLQELIEKFDITQVHKAGAVFDTEKLRWFNKEYLGRMNETDFSKNALAILREELSARKVPFDEGVGARLVPILKERTSIWDDIRKAAREGEYDYFFGVRTLDLGKLPGKDSNKAAAREHLTQVHQLLSEGKEAFEGGSEAIKAQIWPYAGQMGRGAVLWPFRYALTGKEKSPDPFAVSYVMGAANTLSALRDAIKLLSS